MGRRRRARAREARHPRHDPAAARAPRALRRRAEEALRYPAVRPAGDGQDAHRQSRRDVVCAELLLRQGPGAAEHVYRRVGGERAARVPARARREAVRDLLRRARLGRAEAREPRRLGRRDGPYREPAARGARRDVGHGRRRGRVRHRRDEPPGPARLGAPAPGKVRRACTLLYTHILTARCRFDRMLYLGVSETHEAQLNILDALTRKFRLDPGLNLRAVAERCPFNYTGADFYALCSDAMLNAMSRKAEAIEAKIRACLALARTAGD